VRDPARQTQQSSSRQWVCLSTRWKQQEMEERERKSTQESCLSLFCASVRQISLRAAACVCLSHARKHTPRALLQRGNVQCCVCIISVLGDLRPFSLPAKQEWFCRSLQMDVTHTLLIFKWGQIIDDCCLNKGESHEIKSKPQCTYCILCKYIYIKRHYFHQNAQKLPN